MFLACLCAPARCTATVARAKPLQRKLSLTPVSTISHGAKWTVGRVHFFVSADKYSVRGYKSEHGYSPLFFTGTVHLETHAQIAPNLDT
jgi:hypothetical protein